MNRRQLVGASAALGVAVLTRKARARERGDALFRIGAIADVQYADKDDAPPRLYRGAPAKLREAVQALNRADIDFAVHLGDFIDGDWQSYDTVLPLTRGLKSPWHFVLGNHDFAVADEKKPLVPALLGMPARYYRFEHKGWVFVVLDGNDLSTYAWPAGSAELAESTRIHDQKYPKAELWDGGIGEKQLHWLESVLTSADAGHRKVMVLCHFPVYPENQHNLWNASDVMAVLERHLSTKIWLNGHNHDGNYGEKNGIHYLNLKGMLDTTETAYATLAFYEGRVEVKGVGRQSDFVLPLR